MNAEGVGEKQVTREQLYALVWTEPMQALGPRFGLSDVGFKKICKRLRVPTPGRGYWAKKAVGTAPRPTPLPKLPASVRAEQQVSKGCEARGWAVELKEGEKALVTTVIVREEPIGIVLEERIERVERKPDPKVNRSYYLTEYDYIPTGRLTVRLQVSYLGVRQTWSDGAKQRVEDCLNDALVGLVAASEALKEQRLQRDRLTIEAHIVQLEARHLGFPATCQEVRGDERVGELRLIAAAVASCPSRTRVIHTFDTP